MADQAESEPTQGSSSSSAHSNIPLLQGIENYSKWAARMRFYLGGIQATHLIEEDPPRLQNGNFSEKNSKLTGLGLAMMTNRMADDPMDVAVGATTIKEMWTRLYDQYHEVGWGAESILFRELVSLRQSECEDTDSYVAKFRALYLCLSNMGRKLDNWILAITVQNASRKDAEPPEFSSITAQLPDESRILAKSSAGTDATIALFGKQSGKRKFSSTISSNAGPSTKRSSPHSDTNSKKAGYNKATAKCTHCNRSYHAVEDCWFLHPEKAKASWLARNQAESTEQPINLLTIGTFPSNSLESSTFLPSEPSILPPAEQSTFLPDTLVSPASSISFTMPKENEPMPTDTIDPSIITFEGILELDLDLLDTFSQEETISLTENFQPMPLMEDSSRDSDKENEDAIALALDQQEIPED
ncbi:hypothetical protein MMC31_006438 [Peltigera leucophlebia]|nr:hypothetical protein [Peltigera leucophlebia]